MSTESLNYENDVYVVGDPGNEKYVFNSQSYDPDKKFTMGIGRYIFKKIPSGHPMAILNNGLTDKITYTGDQSKMSNRDVNGVNYKFYHGDITVTVRYNSVTDNFGNLSIYCAKHEYMGGQDLLQYENTHPYITSNDVITFIYTDFYNNDIFPMQTDNYLGDLNIKTRYEYWDQSETEGLGLLPVGGISITLLTKSPWMITNPPILEGNNYKVFENWVNDRQGNENKPFNLTKNNFQQIVFDNLKTANFFSDVNIIFDNFNRKLKRIRINSKYVLKFHGGVLEFDNSSVEFENEISIDYYDPLDQDTSPTALSGIDSIENPPPVYFHSSKTGLKNKDIIKYLDLGKLRKFIYKDPETNKTTFGDDGVEDNGVGDNSVGDYVNEYKDIRTLMGGITPETTDGENEFYIRFGEPMAPNGAVAINCFVAGTMIKTDQGEIPIETVSRKKTIDGFKVYCVLTTLLKDKNDYYVLVKKDAFGKNRPNKDIISTKWHGVYVKDEDTEFVRLIDLIDGKNIIKKPVVQPIRFYNICLKDVHHYMYANKLKVETLLPTETILPVYGN